MLLSVGSKRERIDARAIFAYSVNLATVEFDHTLVAAADVEDVGKTVVLLLQASIWFAWTDFPVPVGPMMSMTRTPFT